jgi:hypothetical protein
VHHAVALEREHVGPERREARVGAVAQVHPVHLGRELADDLEVAGVDLVDHRLEQAGEVRVVRGVDGRRGAG